MSFIKPSKNVCKLCLKSVNKKTGIQCHGPCKTWMHYECLNYSPEKIKEFKDGHITINCPCPDCDPKGKLIRLDQGYNCTNDDCVMNKKLNPDGTVNETTQASNNIGKNWPITKCGKNCKIYSSIHPPLPSCESCNSDICEALQGKREGSDTDLEQMKMMCKKVRVITKQINELMVNMKKELKTV